MINERSSAQANTPTSASMQYGYPPSHFDMMNIPTMQNPTDLYSYYPPSLYQPFGTFDDHSQWGSTDTSGNVPQPGPIQYHPQMYTPSPLDIPRSPFDYPPPPPHAYPHYHPGYTPSTFPGPPSTGTSAFDMSWNPHNLSMQQMQVAAQQQMPPIGVGPTSNKKPSVYDEYPPGGVGDMLAQHMNSVDLGNNTNNDDTRNYDNGTNDNSQNVNALSSKEHHHHQQHQQHYQTNSSNLSLSSRPSQAPSSGGPKSYASVVSSDIINTNINKSTPFVPNIPVRSTLQSSTTERNNNTTSNFSNDSTNSRSNTNTRGNNNNNTNNYSQQTRNGTSGYNSRNQQQQQSSASGGFLNWTNSSLPSNSRGNNTNTSSTYYNSASSNYYDRSSYSQQQQQQQQPTSASLNNNNKRQNSNYQQNYSSSRTTNNMSNGNATASTIGQQPISAANQEILDTLKRNHQ
jgi:hypothetical protein